MDFSVSEDHRAIRDGVGAVVRSFDDEYWLARDDDGVTRIRRTFSFEFSDDGVSRRTGRLIMLGERVESLQLEPYRMQ